MKVATTFAALAAVSFTLGCAKGNSAPTNDGAQPVEKLCGADTVQSFAATSPLDPFETDGKVLLDARARAAGLTSLRELAVTLKSSCLLSGRGGAISREVIKDVTTDVQQTASDAHTYTWTTSLEENELRQSADQDECVIGISDSVPLFATARGVDPMLGAQQHLKAIEASTVSEQLGAINLTKPVTIAIIDTGMDMTHEDLKGVLWTNKDEIADNGIDDDRNGYIDDVNGYNFALKVPSPSYSTETSGYQHGTHVAGLAAAQGNNGIGVSGVIGTNARIMALNVFGEGSGAYTSNIANAIRYAADNGADVINLSLGGSGKSATYQSVLAYAIRKGVTIVAAAGNEHREISEKNWMSPAGYAKQLEGMLSVASIDSSNNALSSFSNYSSEFVEIAAPGAEDGRNRVGVLSTWPGGKYARIQGTSMASPVVAGAAGATIALMRARGYAPSPRTVEELLEIGGRTDPALRTKVRGGRALNMKMLSGFIAKTYPFATGPAIDPGVPGYVPCGE